MLSNKVIIVIGGTGLIGQAIVKAVLAQKATCIVGDIQPTELPCDYVPLDIMSEISIQKAIASVKKTHPKIDAVVNCAYPKSPHYGKRMEEVSYSEFCESVNGHLGGYFLCMQQFGLFFREQGFGSMLNFASVYGVIAPRFELYNSLLPATMPVEYAAIKSAIIHLTRYFAKYFKGTGIRFNSISPGGVEDRQDPRFIERYSDYCLSKGMLNADDITGAVVYLLSEGSERVNGQNLIIDDGFTL